MSAQKTQQSQKGFTLIELIAVMVTLGLLAVVAIPKYVNLQKEAAKAQVAGVVGAMNSALAMNYAAWAAGRPDKGADGTLHMVNNFADVKKLMATWPQGEGWDELKLKGNDEWQTMNVTLGGDTYTLTLFKQNFHNGNDRIPYVTYERKKNS